MGAEDPEPALAVETGVAALAPVADGHLIRRVEGTRPWDLAPPSARRALKAMSVGGAIVGVGGLVALLVAASWRFGWYWWWFVGKGGWAVFAGAGAALSRVFTRFVGWQLRRAAGIQMKLGALTGKREGSVVRVMGVVEGVRPFETAVTGRPAVLARYKAVPREGVPIDVTRGQDFRLRLDDGQTVAVAVADAFLTDEPVTASYKTISSAVVPLFPSDGASYRESLVAPGDRAEVIGVLDRVVDPTGDAAPGRGIPTLTMVRGTDHVPLLVRALRSRA